MIYIGFFFQQNNSLLREKSLKEFNKNTWPQILQEIPKHAQRRKEFMVISPFSLLNIEEGYIAYMYHYGIDWVVTMEDLECLMISQN